MFKYGGIQNFFVKILIGLLFLSFSIFALISLITNNEADPKIFSVSPDNDIENFFGIYGAYFSSTMLLFINNLTYLLIAFSFFHSIKLMFGIKSNYISLKILSMTLVIVLLASGFSLINIEPNLLGKIIIDLISSFGFILGEINYYFKLLYFIFIFGLSILLVMYSFEIKSKRLSLVNGFFKYFFKFIFIILSLFKFSWIFKISKNTKKGYYPKKVFKVKSEPTITNDGNNNAYRDYDNKTAKPNLNKEIGISYRLPPLSILKTGNVKSTFLKESEKQNTIIAQKLEKILMEFGVEGQIINFETGPLVTLFEFVPAPGIKNSKVVNLSNDIARSMSSLTARISSQPGKTSIGIEIPNQKRESVFFGDLIKELDFNSKNKIELALGKDIAGRNVFADLKKMPHLLIAGTTGSGKSVGINTMIMSILYTFKPSECKLILIDPKMLELSVYEDIPHLLTPVVTNPNKAVFALKWVVREMENRYQIMSSINVKNIDSFNIKIKNSIDSGRKLFREVQTGIDKDSRKPIIEKKEIPLQIMPLIVVVVDEMADLMMVAGKEVENLIQRLAQMARASGIHLITATQRPSVDVITGTIKANFPSRISYKVASKFDSRTILNEMGAEQLLGSGDMLFLENGAYLKRLHGGFVSEQEIEDVVKHVKKQSQNEPKKDIAIEPVETNNSIGLDFEENDVDELYSKAVEIVLENQKVSTSFIQRYLQIGYNRAARIVEKMEDEGIVSSSNNAGKRTVLKEK